VILAIGGHAHGRTLPRPAHGYSLDTPAPIDRTEFMAAGTAEIPMVMPETVRYELQKLCMRWTGYQGFRSETFRIYVVAGMHPMQAEPWLQLIASWFRLLATPILHQPRMTQREHELPMRLVTSGFLERVEQRRQQRHWVTLDRLVASIWYCGDEHCDCTQPVIERITPNTQAGYPWIRRETLWSGTFLTDTWQRDEEHQQQFTELRDACHRFGVPIPKEAIMRLAGPKEPLP
jgi:hypothetical protein